jgi:hypothetical protein
MDVEVAVGGHLGDRELVLVAVGPEPVVWKVQLGCEPEISAGSDQLRPPSSDQLR